MKIIEAVTSFTRPSDTTAYANLDLVANSVTAGSVVPMTFNVGYGNGLKISRVAIKINSATNTNAKFNLHLYRSSPTCTNGDNGAWLTTQSSYQGFIAVDCTLQTFSDEVKGWGTYVNTSVGVPLVCTLNQNLQLYGLLQATAAYTPTSAGIITVAITGEAYV